MSHFTYKIQYRSLNSNAEYHKLITITIEILSKSGSGIPLLPFSPQQQGIGRDREGTVAVVAESCCSIVPLCAS